VARKWEKRRAARKDRITKQRGIREAELDAADDVIPVREVPLWYALKVSPITQPCACACALRCVWLIWLVVAIENGVGGAHAPPADEP
jgi:hypothetical protein